MFFPICVPQEIHVASPCAIRHSLSKHYLTTSMFLGKRTCSLQIMLGKVVVGLSQSNYSFSKVCCNVDCSNSQADETLNFRHIYLPASLNANHIHVNNTPKGCHAGLAYYKCSTTVEKHNDLKLYPERSTHKEQKRQVKRKVHFQTCKLQCVCIENVVAKT